MGLGRRGGNGEKTTPGKDRSCSTSIWKDEGGKVGRKRGRVSVQAVSGDDRDGGDDTSCGERKGLLKGRRTSHEGVETRRDRNYIVLKRKGDGVGWLRRGRLRETWEKKNLVTKRRSRGGG